MLGFGRATEVRSTFLVGNALEAAIDDRGHRLNGAWFGAFDAGRLVGVVSWVRGPNSLVVACDGHARPLLAAVAGAGVRPKLMVGTQDRVDEAVAAMPPTWRLDVRRRETLMALRWVDRVPARPPRRDTVLRSAMASDEDALHALFEVLSTSAGMPIRSEENRVRASRVASHRTCIVACVDGRPVSMSTRASSTGRYVHVGATATLPAHRRLGLAGACVDRVLDAARAEGVASEGAVLFTGADNVEAQNLYRSLGFRVESPYEMCFLAHEPA